MAGVKLATADRPEEQAKAERWPVALFLAGATMVLAKTDGKPVDERLGASL